MATMEGITTIITMAIPAVVVIPGQPNMPGGQAIITASLQEARVQASRRILHTTTITIPATPTIAGIPAEAVTGADHVTAGLQAAADQIRLVQAAMAVAAVPLAEGAAAGHLQEAAQEVVAGVNLIL